MDKDFDTFTTAGGGGGGGRMIRYLKHVLLWTLILFFYAREYHKSTL